MPLAGRHRHRGVGGVTLLLLGAGGGGGGGGGGSGGRSARRRVAHVALHAVVVRGGRCGTAAVTKERTVEDRCRTRHETRDMDREISRMSYQDLAEGYVGCSDG